MGCLGNVKRYASGYLKEFVTDSGYHFQAYIPDNCTASTSVVVYEHGDDGYVRNWAPYDNRLTSDACDSIIIRADRTNNIDFYNCIAKEYDLTNSQTFMVSFSGGTVYSINESEAMIKQNPSNVPVTVIMDGYVPTDYLSSSGTLSTIKNSNSLILAFAQYNGTNKYVDQYERLAKMGFNIVIFKDKSLYGTSHDGVNASFMENGVVKFLNGTGSLPDNYDIIVYDSNIKAFKSLNYNDVSTVNKVFKYFNLGSSFGNITGDFRKLKDYVLKSDAKTLQNYLNFIGRRVKETHFANMNFSSFGGSSTTSMPSQVPEAVSNYFNNVTTVMNSLAGLMDDIASVHVAYENADNNLKKSIDN